MYFIVLYLVIPLLCVWAGDKRASVTGEARVLHEQGGARTPGLILIYLFSFSFFLFGQVMNTLALRARGEYCTNRVVHACLVFVGPATELSHTYKLLKPHLDFLLFQAVFPELCLSKSDVEVNYSFWLAVSFFLSYWLADWLAGHWQRSFGNCWYGSCTYSMYRV